MACEAMRGKEGAACARDVEVEEIVVASRSLVVSLALLPPQVWRWGQQYRQSVVQVRLAGCRGHAA